MEAHDESCIVTLDRLNHTARRAGCDSQPWHQPFDRLVMRGVDRQFMAEQPAQQGAGSIWVRWAAGCPLRLLGAIRRSSRMPETAIRKLRE